MLDSKRHSVRFCTPLKVYEVGDDPSNSFITKDLSLTGIFLLMKPIWAIEKVVKLRICHRYGNLEVKAQVRHIQKDGLGLQFINPSRSFKQAIQFIIDELVIQIPTNKIDSKDQDLPITWVNLTQQVQATINNLTQRGAFVFSQVIPKVGSQICIYLPKEKIKRNKALACESMITHQTDLGFGITFLNPEEEFLYSVKELIKT